MQVAKSLALFAQRTQQSTCLSEQRTEGIKDMMCSGSYSALHFAVFFLPLVSKTPFNLSSKELH